MGLETSLVAGVRISLGNFGGSETRPLFYFSMNAVLGFLQALVPVTIEVEVPFDLHRFIIGQKGVGIRKMMDEFEVSCYSLAWVLEN